MSDCWSTNVVASDDEGPVPPGGGPLPPAGNNQLPLPLPFGAVGNEQDPQRLRPSNRYEIAIFFYTILFIIAEVVRLEARRTRIEATLGRWMQLRVIRRLMEAGRGRDR